MGAGCQREPFAKQLPRGGTLPRNYLGLTVYSPKGLSDRRMPTPDSLAKFNVKTGDSTRSPCVSSRPMAHGARHTVAARQLGWRSFFAVCWQVPQYLSAKTDAIICVAELFRRIGWRADRLNCPPSDQA